MENRYWKFTHSAGTIDETVQGRDHHWYFNPQLSEKANNYMVKVRIRPGGGHDFHRHPEMDEILFVLSGKAEQWVEDEKRILLPGDSVYIAADVVHATINAGEEDLEFLAILSPSTGWAAGTLDESQNMPYLEYR